MTKKNIVRRIADELDHTERETQQIVQRTLDVIISVLAEEGRVELRNFGVFTVKKRSRGGAAIQGPARSSWSRTVDSQVQAGTGSQRPGCDGLRWSCPR